MATDTDRLTTSMSDLIDTLKQSSFTSQAANQVLEKKTQKAIHEMNNTVKGSLTSQKKMMDGFSGNVRLHAKLSGKMFEEAMENLQYDKLDMLPEVFNKHLKDSKLAGVVKPMRSIGELVKKNLEMQAKIQPENLKKIVAYRKMQDKTSDAAKVLKKELDDVGYSNEDLNSSVMEITKSAKEYNKVVERAAHESQGGAFGEILGKGGVLAKKLSIAGGILLTGANALKDTAESAARFGTQIEYLDAALMGMSSEELNQVQADNRQAINSSSMTFDEFNDTIKEGQSEMWGFTGSLRDAARINADAMTQAKLLGTEQNSFMEQQRKQFQKFNNVFSMTAEQFMEMNNQLMDSSEVRTQLYKLNENQRAAHFKQLQQTYQQIRDNGLLHEQAVNVIKTLDEMGGKSPKERMKEAAKLQATMGAMGMGAQGAQAAGLLRGGLRTEKDKAAFADIMKQANIAMSDQMGQGFGNEMMLSQIVESTGIGKYLGPDSPFAAFAIQQGLANKGQDPASKRASEMHQTMSGVFTLTEQTNSILKHPLTITGIAGIGGTLLGIHSLLKSGMAMGAMTGLAGGGKGGLLKGMSKALNLGKFAKGLGALGAATYGLEQAYKAYTTGESDIHSFLQEQFPDLMQGFGDGVGYLVDGVKSWWGDEEAKSRKLNTKLLEEREKREMKDRHQREKSEKINIAAVQKMADAMEQTRQLMEQSKGDERKRHEEALAAQERVHKILEEQMGQAQNLTDDQIKANKTAVRQQRLQTQ